VRERVLAFLAAAFGKDDEASKELWRESRCNSICVFAFAPTPFVSHRGPPTSIHIGNPTLFWSFKPQAHFCLALLGVSRTS